MICQLFPGCLVIAFGLHFLGLVRFFGVSGSDKRVELSLLGDCRRVWGVWGGAKHLHSSIPVLHLANP